MTTAAFWLLVNSLCDEHDGSVISGKRSPVHNKRVGGRDTSRHLEGRAADIRCETREERDGLFEDAYRVGLRGYKTRALFMHLQADAPRS